MIGNENAPFSWTRYSHTPGLGWKNGTTITFPATATMIGSLPLRIRDYGTDRVRAVFPDDDGDPESATESLLAMFKPFE
jgi:hypothetical protein